MTTPFLVYMHGTRLTFGKPFVRKQYNVLIFFNRLCEKHGSADRIIRELLLKPISVPISNEQTLDCDKI